LASRGQLTGLGGSSPRTLTALTAYARDGQVAVTKQPNMDTTTTAYDLADEALTTTLLSNGTTTTEATYGYDGAGNQATSTDTDGRTVSTVYDPDNRVAQTTATGGGTVTVATTLGYDPDGNTVAQTARTTDSAHPGQAQVATHAATYLAVRGRVVGREVPYPSTRGTASAPGTCPDSREAMRWPLR